MSTSGGVVTLEEMPVRLERQLNEGLQRSLGRQIRPVEDLVARVEPTLRAGVAEIDLAVERAATTIGAARAWALESIASERDAALAAIRAAREAP